VEDRSPLRSSRPWRLVIRIVLSFCLQSLW
jgi:hypothetical protein